MSNRKTFWPALITLVFLASCATYTPQFSKGADGVQEEAITPTSDSATLRHRLILLGNIGLADNPEAMLKAASQHWSQADPQYTSVLFLGGQLSQGLSSRSDSSRFAAGKQQLDYIRQALTGFGGKVFFMAGDTDWQHYGLSGVSRQWDYLQEALGKKATWLPRPGCGDPAEVTLAEDLVLVLIDSQWWLSDWDQDPQINQGCELQGRNFFFRYIEDAIKGNRGKEVIVAVHHPPFTNGIHGGQYPLRRHLFPLTFLAEPLWLPIPGIGSLVAATHSALGNRQQVTHPQYRELRNALVNSGRKNGNLIFVSAHENNQQYWEKDGQHFIVTGAGNPLSAARIGNGALYTQGTAGFAELEFWSDGSANVRFFNLNDQGVATQVYQRQVKEAPPKTSATPPINPTTTSSSTTLTSRDFSRKGFGRLLWGQHYREAYAIPVTPPALDLDTVRGGLTPIKLGGGYQTNSLRLRNPEGREYVLRALEKDASRTVPYPFNESFVREVFEDNFSASHPLSALPITPLAEAAGILHTHPELVFVPNQEGMGPYAGEFSNAAYLFEERPDDNLWADREQFGYPDRIVSTAKALDKILEEGDHQIDYAAVAKARIFDLLVGDWDRHDDQWRWAMNKQGGIHYYRPIPRDRDQAFSQYDGLLMSIARRTLPMAKVLRPYTPTIPKIAWTSYGARQFDPTFLAGAPWEAWEKAAKEIQQALPDELITAAFREQWPAAFYEQDAPRIITALRQRRDDLLSIARRFYLFNNHKVDVLGTRGDDRFIVNRLADGKTRVEAWTLTKRGQPKDLFFQRTFEAKETKEIIFFGLEGEDEFLLRGKAPRGSRLRIIGGPGTDTVKDSSIVSGPGRKNRIYEIPGEENVLIVGTESRVQTPASPVFHSYHRQSRDYEFDYSILLPLLNVNPDDGLLLGLGGQATTYGFRRDPYATFHQFQLQYAMATSGWLLNYDGLATRVIGNWQLGWNILAQSPLYAINFYGLGNSSLNWDATQEEDYVRIRQRVLRVAPRLQYKSSGGWLFKFGPMLESVQLENTPDRLINDLAPQILPVAFRGLESVGVDGSVTWRNVDNEAFPTVGAAFGLQAGWRQSLDTDGPSFPFLAGSFSLYVPLDPDRKLVLAARSGGKHLLNDNYVFFQGATLGGGGPQRNFRGVRRERFTGQSAFYSNLDLRWKIWSSHNRTLPFSGGLLAGFDTGRVWSGVPESAIWHTALGGGIFISPFDMASITLQAFHTDDDAIRFTLGGGFFF
ncbi:MAG: hypothetical protein H6555_09905 [Lewinellaceae bacterium]|nr:hypothetical protein [Lewinellaceae bacterium]